MKAEKTTSQAGEKRLTIPAQPRAREAERKPSRMAPRAVGRAVWRRLGLGCCGLALWAAPIFAERYLTVKEAEEVCFPEADQFLERTVHLKGAEKEKIRQASGVKVPGDEVRFWVARSGSKTVGVLILDHVYGKHDLIEYAVALRPEGAVKQVEILEYHEKYGSGIRDPKWRRQFVGKTMDSPLKLDEDIYNISGATISCRHLTEGVKRVVSTYGLVVGPRLRAAGHRDQPGQRKP